MQIFDDCHEKFQRIQIGDIKEMAADFFEDSDKKVDAFIKQDQSYSKPKLVEVKIANSKTGSIRSSSFTMAT